MYQQIDFKELKEIEKQIAKGIDLKDNFPEVKVVAAFCVTFREKKAICAAVVLDNNSLEIIEKREVTTEEILPYSPGTVAFREGPAILACLKELTNKPDLLVIEGFGALHPFRVGTASYVGVLSNKPSIGVSDTLMLGGLEEDKIMLNNVLRGFALRTKEFANPVYVTPAHRVSPESAVEFVKKWVNPEVKMPYPLHMARKALLKVKNELNQNIKGKVSQGIVG